MNIYELYEKANVVTKENYLDDKYTYLTYKGLIDMRTIDYSFMINNPDSSLVDLIIQEKVVYLLPNIFEGQIIDIYIRGRETQNNPKILRNKNLLYGLNTFNKDFKYGDPIFLVEGIADYGALKFIKNDLNVIALRGDSLSKENAKILSTLSNNIILIPDNDGGGKISIKNIKPRLRKLGIDLKIFNNYGSFKDTGDLIDLVIKVENGKANNIEEIKTIVSYYESGIKLYGS